MARTEVRGAQIKDGDVKRADLNVSTTGQAVTRRIIAGTNVTLSSTGVDTGTGDVTINAEVEFAQLQTEPTYVITTSDDTETTLGEIAILDDNCTTFQIFVSAQLDDVSNKNYWAVINGAVRRRGAGSAQLVGTYSINEDEEGASGYISGVDVSGNNLRIRVTGATGEDVNWKARAFLINGQSDAAPSEFPAWDSVDAFDFDLIEQPYIDRFLENKILSKRNISTFGSLAGSMKWAGTNLAPNGKIYAIPYSSTTVLKIDPDTDTASTFGSLSGTEKWASGVLAQNGKIYAPPALGTNILKIDPDTDIASTFGSFGAGYKWWGGVLAPNGNIYCYPYAATSILKIDPSTDTSSTFGSLTYTTEGWLGGALAPNGKIYCSPGSATTILKIDPDTDTASQFGSIAGTSKYWGAILAPNGMIYCVPHNSTTVLKIDPNTDTVSTFGSVSGSTQKWVGGFLAPNGTIYCIPRTNTNTILAIDTTSDTVSEFGSIAGSNKYSGGAVFAPNGHAYAAPYEATTVLKLILSGKEYPLNFCLNPYFNKSN
jgi:streptogramin lyase